MLNDAVQVTSADEFIYHEMMSHVPILKESGAQAIGNAGVHSF